MGEITSFAAFPPMVLDGWWGVLLNKQIFALCEQPLGRLANTLLYLLYRTVGYALYALLVLWLPLSRMLGGRYGYVLGQRLGCYQRSRLPEREGEPTLWLHASSVGEVQAALILIDALLKLDEPVHLVLTSTTEQGHRMALARIGDRVACHLAPLDLVPAVNVAIRTLRPDLYIGLETELWPVLLTTLGKRGVPKLLLNGRLSERSLRRYHHVSAFIQPLVAGFQALAVITTADANRFAALGASPCNIQVCGNLKYDMPAEQGEAKRRQLRSRLGIAADQSIFLCGSTHEGEEELLLTVYRALAAECSLVWLVAPRHLERLAAIESLFNRAGVPFDRYSQLAGQPRQQAVVLIDTMGDLAELYCAGDYLFCGGSLVDRGGHNIMEAARWGRPVCFGPFIKDFNDAATLLRESGGGFQVADAEALTACLRHLHRHPAAYDQACAQAASVAADQQGAVARQVALVRQWLADRPHQQPSGTFAG